MERVDLAQSLMLDGEGHVLLLLTRAGSWSFPGGRRGDGETLAEAAIRETKLRTGVTVEVERVAAIGESLTRLSDIHNLFVVFGVRAVEGTAEPQGHEDVLELRWAAPDEADWLVPWYPGGVGRLLERRDTLYYAQEAFE